MSSYLSYLAYLVGWKIIAFLPEKTAYRLFALIGTFLYKRNGKSVRRLRTNLSIVRPDYNSKELERLVLAGYQSYLRYWCDTFRIHTWSQTRISSTVTLVNDELLRQPMRDGLGVVIALPHSVSCAPITTVKSSVS